MGLYVTTKGILFMSCGSLLSLSALSLEVDVVFYGIFYASSLVSPLQEMALHFFDALLKESLVGAYSS